MTRAKTVMPIDPHVMACAVTSGGLWAKHFCEHYRVSRYQLDNAVRRLTDLGYLSRADGPQVVGWIHLKPTGTW